MCVHFSIRVVPQGEVFRQSSAISRASFPAYFVVAFASSKAVCQWKTRRITKIVDGFSSFPFDVFKESSFSFDSVKAFGRLSGRNGRAKQKKKKVAIFQMTKLVRF